MAKYIKRELADLLLIQRAEEYAKCGANYALTIIQGDRAVIHTIEQADVRENVKGEWKHTEAYPHKVYCSNCFATYLQNEKWAAELPIKLHPNYCPNCGASMQTEQKGSD